MTQFCLCIGSNDLVLFGRWQPSLLLFLCTLRLREEEDGREKGGGRKEERERSRQEGGQEMVGEKEGGKTHGGRGCLLEVENAISNLTSMEGMNITLFKSTGTCSPIALHEDCNKYDLLL